MTNANSNINVISKSDLSTKPSTLHEEKEPMPSFLKALNVCNIETLDLNEEVDILDGSLSHVSGPFTESSEYNDASKIFGCQSSTSRKSKSDFNL